MLESEEELLESHEPGEFEEELPEFHAQEDGHEQQLPGFRFQFSKNSEGKTMMHADKFGRQHYSIPSTGRSYIHLRANMFERSTGATHYHELTQVIQKFRSENPGPDAKNLVLLIDGGSDFTIKSTKNGLWYNKLFEDLKLESLTVCMYAANLSAYNRI